MMKLLLRIGKFVCFSKLCNCILNYFFSKTNNSLLNSNIPEMFTCDLCSNLLNDAVSMLCCGKSYCAKCLIDKVFNLEIHICPACHVTIGDRESSTYDNLRLRMMIRDWFNNQNNKFKTDKKITEKVSFFGKIFKHKI